MEVNLHAFLAEGKEDLHIVTVSPVGQLSPVVGVSTVVSTGRRPVTCLVWILGCPLCSESLYRLLLSCIKT
jgi:hypothetical protein